jgi:acyl carrier protein
MEIQENVKSFVVTNFFLDTSIVSIEANTSFLESSIIDSTGILEVIGFLEETYNIKVEDHEMLPENLDSIANISSFILRKKAK